MGSREDLKKLLKEISVSTIHQGNYPIFSINFDHRQILHGDLQLYKNELQQALIPWIYWPKEEPGARVYHIF
jgi:hypothetical protein